MSYKFIQSFQVDLVRLAQYPKQEVSYFLKNEQSYKIDFFSACRLGIQVYIYLIPGIHVVGTTGHAKRYS